MNYEQTDKHAINQQPPGYQFIVDDTEEKYIYLTLKGGDRRETTRDELLEILRSGKPLPFLEVKEKH